MVLQAGFQDVSYCGAPTTYFVVRGCSGRLLLDPYGFVDDYLGQCVRFLGSFYDYFDVME